MKLKPEIWILILAVALGALAVFTIDKLGENKSLYKSLKQLNDANEKQIEFNRIEFEKLGDSLENYSNETKKLKLKVLYLEEEKSLIYTNRDENKNNILRIADADSLRSKVAKRYKKR